MTKNTNTEVAEKEQMCLIWKNFGGFDGISIYIAGTGKMTLTWNMGVMQIREVHYLSAFDEKEWNIKWEYRYSNSSWKDSYYYDFEVYGFSSKTKHSTHTVTITGENVTHLCCDDINLIMLDISGNTALKHLECSDNQLTELDISKNIELSYLDCSSNQLTSLDVSKNSKLAELYYEDNQLSKDVFLNDLLMKEALIAKKDNEQATQAAKIAKQREENAKQSEEIAEKAARIAELEQKLGLTQKPTE